jgi:hypothetical protein
MSEKESLHSPRFDFQAEMKNDPDFFCGEDLEPVIKIVSKEKEPSAMNGLEAMESLCLRLQ